MGHVDTPAAQSAHMLRWRQGRSTTALGRARQTTHDASSGSSTTGGGGGGGAAPAGGGGAAGALGLGWATPVTGASNDAPLGGGRNKAFNKSPSKKPCLVSPRPAARRAPKP